MAMIELGEDDQNSEQLLVDHVNGIEFDNNGLEIEGDELEIEGVNLDLEPHGLGIEGTGLEIEENSLDTEGDGFENNCEQMLEIEEQGLGNLSEDVTASQGNLYLPPVVGMEFDSYDDAYNYYNVYAKDLGFAIRVKSSWTKRNSKEKRGAVLCCNCEGFKTMKEANSRRKETRTGCLAMVRLRLVESNRWRVDEVKLDHNHSFDPDRAQNSKSHKKMDSGTKRKMEPNVDVEVRTIKLYRTATSDPLGYGSSNSNEGEASIRTDVSTSKRLKLKKGDVQALHRYFSRAQLTDPGFFYLMDLNDEGFLRNVFWIGSRSRAAYGYFGDVVIFDTSCLSSRYDIPLFSFVGINHHGQRILLGCGLLVDESYETYIWLFRAWVTCMSGRPPQTVITEHRCQAMQTAISEVFPRSHHRLSLPCIVQSILESFVTLEDYATFETILNATVYDFLRVDEFEMAWDSTMQRFGLAGNVWLRTLYEDRERWAPVYSKDTFFAGVSVSQRGGGGESDMALFFEGYIHRQTSLQEFLDEIYESALQKMHRKEALDDSESRSSTLPLRTSSQYELQLSKLYTNSIFKDFQDEIAMMSSCLVTSQVNANGLAVMYTLKEHEEDDENLTDVRNVEVVYDKAGAEVRCSCSCFSFKGYLCRHALFILNYNGVEEVPIQYVLARWRKDLKRIYVAEIGAGNVDIANPVQRFDHLYKRAMQVVGEGMVSGDRYRVAWEAFKDSLNKIKRV
ncbi:Protein FAR1-RELATED SEQUENCE 8 [Linum perenne]